MAVAFSTTLFNWLEHSWNPLSQSEAKLKLFVTWSLTFFRVWRRYKYSLCAFIGFFWTTLFDWLEHSWNPLNQSEAKLKLFVTWSLTFSRAWHRLQILTLCFHWLLLKFSSLLIGHCDDTCFGFKKLVRKAL